MNGRETREFPAAVSDVAAAKPVLEWLPGWKCSTAGATRWEELPENARKYLLRMAELVESNIAIVSVGPRRDQTFQVTL